MKSLHLLIEATVITLVLLTCDARTTLDTPLSSGETTLAPSSVMLVSASGEAYSILLDTLRAQFCSREGNGPCYDYQDLFVHFDNCGVTAFPLSDITYFENTGAFSPTFCVKATQSAQIATTLTARRDVFVSDHYWSFVGEDVATGASIEVPFSELSYFEQQQREP
jgi:hypothetical protein